jgi:hypothetical protein
MIPSVRESDRKLALEIQLSRLAPVMKPEVLLELLENAADQLGIRLTYENLQSTVGGGGLCKVKGEFRIIIDRRATSEERVVTIASALSKFDTTELELADKVREVIRTYESSGKHRRTAA